MLMLSCNLIPSSDVLSKSLLVVLVKVLFAHLANRAKLIITPCISCRFLQERFQSLQRQKARRMQQSSIINLSSNFRVG